MKIREYVLRVTGEGHALFHRAGNCVVDRDGNDMRMDTAAGYMVWSTTERRTMIPLAELVEAAEDHASIVHGDSS